jgi:hypothetical protein
VDELGGRGKNALAGFFALLRGGLRGGGGFVHAVKSNRRPVYFKSQLGVKVGASKIAVFASTSHLANWH